VSTELKNRLKIEKIAFSQSDIDLLTYDLVPKTKRNTFYASLIFLALIPIMPFLPARITHKTLVQSMTYESAFIVYCFVNGLVIWAIYYLGIVCLKRDVSEGCKYQYRTQVVSKSRRGFNDFELELAVRPKNVSKMMLPNKEFNKWHQGEVLEIEYLKRSGTILAYKKVEN
jgi:hypothetical protein